MIEWLFRKIARKAFLQPENDKFWGYIIPDAFDSNKPYLTRVLFPRIFGFRPMLHYFHSADEDRNLHNHPWEWALSIILTGGYTEERLVKVIFNKDDTIQQMSEVRSLGGWRRINLIKHTDFHRIEKLHGSTWTLFIAGPRAQDWGFLENGKTVHWKDWIAARRADRNIQPRTN